MTDESNRPALIKSSALRPLSISQPGTAHLLSRVQRTAERATASHVQRVARGMTSLDLFAGRIADRFPPIAAKYEARAMSKPRQELPLADSRVPSLSPLETASDLPSVEATTASPFSAQRAAETVQRTAATPRPAMSAPTAKQPAVQAAQPVSTAAIRVQRTPLEPGAVEAGEPSIDRSALPSITRQLRQMRPATMPKPKETSTGETISASPPATLQRAPAPDTADTTTRPPIGPRPISRPAQTEGPIVRRKPRAQITEVMPNALEPAAPVTAINAVEPIDSAPQSNAQPLQVQRSSAPEAVDSSSEPAAAPDRLDGSTSTAAAYSSPSADVSPSAAPSSAAPPSVTLPTAISPSVISPRQLARLFTAAKTGVQRQAHEAASQPRIERAPEPSAEQVRVRRFVETVQREAQAFTGQAEVGESATSSETSEASGRPQAAQHSASVQQQASSAEVSHALPVTDRPEPAIQRAPEPDASVIEAAPSQTVQAAPTIQRAPQTGPLEREAASPPAAPRPVDQTTASPVIQRAADSSPTEPVDRVATVSESTPLITPSAPAVQRAPDEAARPSAPTAIRQTSAPVDHVGEILEATSSVAAASEPVESASPAITPIAAPAITSAPPRVARTPDVTHAEAPPMSPPPTVTRQETSGVEAAPVTATDAPASGVQRDVEPTPEPEPVKSITAQLRRRIAERAQQPIDSPADTIEAEGHTVSSAEAAPLIQRTSSGEGEARVQRRPDWPPLQRAQTGRSGGEDQSAAATDRTAAPSTRIDERIQRASESTVSSAPVDRIQRVLGEAGESGAAIDLNKLARDVYPYVKRLIAIERERRG